MVRLEQVLDSWKAVRADTVAAVEEFPEGEFDFKPCGEVMSFGEIARHILISGHGLTGLRLEGEEKLGGPQFREKMDGAQVTRLEMLQFVKEHELTHRAQLFLYMRLKGMVPATTRRRLAKQAAR